jgi:hypothetical protein
LTAHAAKPAALVLYSGKRMKMRITRIAGCWYDKARGDQDFRSVLERSRHYTRFLPLPPMHLTARPAAAYLRHCTIDIDSSMPQINKTAPHAFVEKKRHRKGGAKNCQRFCKTS